jgi:hypothetical protein
VRERHGPRRGVPQRQASDPLRGIPRAPCGQGRLVRLIECNSGDKDAVAEDAGGAETCGDSLQLDIIEGIKRVGCHE